MIAMNVDMCSLEILLIKSFFMLVLSSADFFFNSLRNTIRVSNSLDPDQAIFSVGPNLGPNCLQRLSAYSKNRCCKERVKESQR